MQDLPLATAVVQLQRSQAFAYAIFRESRNASDLELVHDLFAVRFHCLDAQLEPCGNIFC